MKYENKEEKLDYVSRTTLYMVSYGALHYGGKKLWYQPKHSVSCFKIHNISLLCSTTTPPRTTSTESVQRNIWFQFSSSSFDDKKLTP